jgi:hypothetical protein
MTVKQQQSSAVCVLVSPCVTLTLQYSLFLLPVELLPLHSWQVAVAVVEMADS